MPCVNRNRHAFSPMTFNTEGLPRTPCSKGFGSTKAVQKFWILRKRLETQGQEMAPQVGLEPTTLRLTAGCSAIELLRSGGTLPTCWLSRKSYQRRRRLGTYTGGASFAKDFLCLPSATNCFSAAAQNSPVRPASNPFFQVLRTPIVSSCSVLVDSLFVQKRPVFLVRLHDVIGQPLLQKRQQRRGH